MYQDLTLVASDFIFLFSTNNVDPAFFTPKVRPSLRGRMSQKYLTNKASADIKPSEEKLNHYPAFADRMVIVELEEGCEQSSKIVKDYLDINTAHLLCYIYDKLT